MGNGSKREGTQILRRASAGPSKGERERELENFIFQGFERERTRKLYFPRIRERERERERERTRKLYFPRIVERERERDREMCVKKKCRLTRAGAGGLKKGEFNSLIRWLDPTPGD